MSRTPKVVRRNWGNCICPDQLRMIKEKNFDDGYCKKGYCFSAKCRTCHGELFGMGPVGCPCEHTRDTRYPGMRKLGHWRWPGTPEKVFVPARVAIKASKRRNQ